MPLPVQLKAVVDEIETGTEDWQAYINRKTGELVSFRADAQVEDDEPLDEGWGLEEWQDCKRVLEDQDFIELPNQHDVDEYSIMKRFSLARDGEKERDGLLDAVAGRGAFRLFKSTIRRRGIEQDWYRYRDQAIKAIAADFLDAHDIPYVDDSAKT